MAREEYICSICTFTSFWLLNTNTQLHLVLMQQQSEDKARTETLTLSHGASWIGLNLYCQQEFDRSLTCLCYFLDVFFLKSPKLTWIILRWFISCGRVLYNVWLVGIMKLESLFSVWINFLHLPCPLPFFNRHAHGRAVVMAMSDPVFLPSPQ